MRWCATQAGLSPTAWSDLEAGKHTPTTDTLHGVARVFRWPLTWFDQLQAGTPWLDLPEVDHPPRLTTDTRIAELEARVRTLEESLVAAVALSAQVEFLAQKMGVDLRTVGGLPRTEAQR